MQDVSYSSCTASHQGGLITLDPPLPLPHISPPEALHNAMHGAQQDTALSVDVTFVLALQCCSFSIAI